MNLTALGWAKKLKLEREIEDVKEDEKEKARREYKVVYSQRVFFSLTTTDVKALPVFLSIYL